MQITKGKLSSCFKHILKMLLQLLYTSTYVYLGTQVWVKQIQGVYSIRDKCKLLLHHSSRRKLAITLYSRSEWYSGKKNKKYDCAKIGTSVGTKCQVRINYELKCNNSLQKRAQNLFLVCFFYFNYRLWKWRQFFALFCFSNYGLSSNRLPSLCCY